MLNSRSFTQYPRASAIVYITCLLVTIGGCSAAKSPEASSATANSVVTEKTAPIKSSAVIEETSPSPSDLVTDEAAPTPIDIKADSTFAKAEQSQEIPEPFRGVWNSDIEQCGSHANDSRLEIDATQIQFHESRGSFQVMTSDGERKLIGTVELSGEGETWLTDLELQLSEDRNALTAISDDSSFVRYRCS